VPGARAYIPPLGHLEKCSVLSGVDISLYATRLGSSGNTSPAVTTHIQGQPKLISTHKLSPTSTLEVISFAMVSTRTLYTYNALMLVCSPSFCISLASMWCLNAA
jgi:hypothetical protein